MCIASSRSLPACFSVSLHSPISPLPVATGEMSWCCIGAAHVPCGGLVPVQWLRSCAFASCLAVVPRAMQQLFLTFWWCLALMKQWYRLSRVAVESFFIGHLQNPPSCWAPCSGWPCVSTAWARWTQSSCQPQTLCDSAFVTIKQKWSFPSLSVKEEEGKMLCILAVVILLQPVKPDYCRESWVTICLCLVLKGQWCLFVLKMQTPVLVSVEVRIKGRTDVSFVINS